MRVAALLLPMAVLLTSAVVAADDKSSAPPVAPPDVKSARPKMTEWKDAPVVKLRRTSVRAARCEARLVREWLRVRCASGVSAITQLGGTVDQVAAITWKDGTTAQSIGGEVIFPVRRGDRRVIQFWTFAEGYDGPLTVLPDFVLQEDWQSGSAPVVLAI